MAKKKFLVNIDLNLNQLINSRAENGTGFTTGGIDSKGRLMYDTSTNRVLYDTGVAIESIANLNDVTGLLDFQGGYNALTNTPNLINPPSGTINKGDYYIVTEAGTFYGALLEIGDSLFASVNNPTTLSGWVIVQANVVYATETIAGIILLATQEEVNMGTNNSKAVTPLTLATYVANNKQNIYNIDGTLTANRTITLDDKNLTFIGSGTSFIDYNINNGVQSAIQTFNANLVSHYIYNETLQLFSKANVENGIVSLKVFNVALTIDRSLIVNQFGTRINSIYYLPNTDGTAGQVISTDGSGNLGWANGVIGSGVNNALAFWTNSSTISYDVNLRRGTSGGDSFIQTLGINLDVTIGGGSVGSGVDIRSNLNGISAIYSYGFGSSSLVFQRRRGTKSAPTEALSGDTIGNIQFNNVGVLQVKSTENGSSGWGNTVTFYTGVQGTTTQQEVLRLTTDNKVKISNSYFLPNTDGTAGQVMTTDGSGNLSFQTLSSTNIYNTNGTLTANRNVTINDRSLVFGGNEASIYRVLLTDATTNEYSYTDNTLTNIYNEVGNNTFNTYSRTLVGTDFVEIISTGVSKDTKIVLNPNTITSTVSLGVQSCITALTINGLRINNVYTLPKVDGTAGQVLTTNGLGVVTWGTSSSVNIYNANGSITTNRTVDFSNKNIYFDGNGGQFRAFQYDFATEKSSQILNTLTSNSMAVADSSFGNSSQIEVTQIQILNTVANDTVSTSVTQSPFTLTTKILDTFGTNIAFQVVIDSFGLNINNAYTLPKVDGTAGQVLTTNGSGIVSWGAGGSVNIYNTNGTLTANRTVTLGNYSLNVVGNLGGQEINETLSDTTTGFFTRRIQNADSFSIEGRNSGNEFGALGVLQDRFFAIVRISPTIFYGIEADINGTRINQQYFLPNTDGTAGQVLTTNGAGLTSWSSGSSVNIYNTDGTLTANRIISGASKTITFNNVSAFAYNLSPIVGTVQSYEISIDSTNISAIGVARLFRIVDSSSGFERFGITKSGNVKISDAFILPLSDGTAGQVLTTNGAGVTSWGNSSSTNIYNTDGTLTANRTVTIGTNNLSFSGTSGQTSFSRTNGGSTQSLSFTSIDFQSVIGTTSTSSTISQLNSQIYLNIDDVINEVTLFSLGITPNGLNINNNYILPKVDGIAGQVLTTSGTGVVTWQTSGIGTSDIWKLNPNETYRGVSFNNNSTTVVTDGGVTLSVSASTLAQSVASTNFATKQIRLRYYASVVSAGRYTGLRGTSLLWFMQGGFRYVCDFNISDTAFSSGTQQFYGMASSTADLNYGTVSGFLVSSLINIIGVGNETGDANLQIFHNDATGTATKIDLGASFPANRTAGAISTTVYEVQLINLPATTTVLYRVINKETGAIATGTVATNLPDASLGLNFFASRCMSTLASVTNSGQFDCSKVGVYSML
jgi:hypothetical protein